MLGVTFGRTGILKPHVALASMELSLSANCEGTLWDSPGMWRWTWTWRCNEGFSKGRNGSGPTQMGPVYQVWARSFPKFCWTGAHAEQFPSAWPGSPPLKLWRQWHSFSLEITWGRAAPNCMGSGAGTGTITKKYWQGDTDLFLSLHHLHGLLSMVIARSTKASKCVGVAVQRNSSLTSLHNPH